MLAGVALSQIGPACNLGTLLDSQLLPKKQVTVMAGMTFAQLCIVHQLYPFLDWGAALEKIWKFHLVQNALAWACMCLEEHTLHP